MKTTVKLLLVLGLAVLIGAGQAGAEAAEGTPWNRLTPEQRQMLRQAHEERWNSMSAEQQQRMLKGIERWQNMTPQERARIREKREKFRSMSPGERAEMRAKFHERREAFESLTPDQQSAIRECHRRKHGGEDLDCRALWPKGGKDVPAE